MIGSFLTNGILAPKPGSPPIPPTPTTTSATTRGQRLHVRQHAVRINGVLYTGDRESIETLLTDHARGVVKNVETVSNKKARKGARSVAAEIVVPSVDIQFQVVESAPILDAIFLRQLQSEYRRFYIQTLVEQMAVERARLVREAKDAADIDQIMRLLDAQEVQRMAQIQEMINMLGMQ